MKNATKAVIAGVAGIALLSGGAGSLAYWTDTQTGSSIAIQSGTLTLGSIADGSWTLQQNAADMDAGTASTTTTPYSSTTTPIVPGDTLTQTVSVPVTLTGTDNKARLQVARAGTGTANALESALSPTIVSVNGVAGTNALITASGNVQVVVKISFPWTGTGASAPIDNSTKALSTTYQLNYTLTQVPVSATS